MNFVQMGQFYRSKSQGLIKVVCRGTDVHSGDPMIAYANVGEGGCVSEIYFLLESEFKNNFTLA